MITDDLLFIHNFMFIDKIEHGIHTLYFIYKGVTASSKDQQTCAMHRELLTKHDAVYLSINSESVHSKLSICKKLSQGGLRSSYNARIIKNGCSLYKMLVHFLAKSACRETLLSCKHFLNIVEIKKILSLLDFRISGEVNFFEVNFSNLFIHCSIF